MINRGGIEKAATATSELLGTATSPLATALLGGALGGGVGALSGKKGGPLGGAALGALLGGGAGVAGNALGPLAALVTKSKTDEDMEEAGKSSILDYILPGRASYGLLKRIGHSQNKYD